MLKFNSFKSAYTYEGTDRIMVLSDLYQRYINPDKSVGGYVILNAGTYVDDTCYIGKYCTIGGDVRIYENVKIDGFVSIYDNVMICDGVKINGNVRIYDGVTIHNGAEINGDIQIAHNMIVIQNAYVTKQNDFIYIKNIGSINSNMLLTKNKNGDILIRVDNFYGTENEYIEFIKLREEYCRQSKIYLEIIKLFKNTLSI